MIFIVHTERSRKYPAIHAISNIKSLVNDKMVVYEGLNQESYYTKKTEMKKHLSNNKIILIVLDDGEVIDQTLKELVLDLTIECSTFVYNILIYSLRFGRKEALRIHTR